MKKKLLFLVAFAALCACTNESLMPKDEEVESATINQSAFNRDMRGIAYAVSRAIVDNDEFRRLVKSDALKQFDGDYDILVSDISSKRIPASNGLATKSVDGTVSVEELLEFYMPAEVKSAAGDSVLAKLQEQYPYAQISVPVHADEWDAENYVPLVAFLEDDYDDATVETIQAYDPDGNLVSVDAVNEPEDPVIVISTNERVILDTLGGTILPFPVKVVSVDTTFVVVPESPRNLKAVSTNNGIALSWDKTGVCTKYYVWRKKETESKFTKIGTSEDSANRTYSDLDVTSNAYYYYYVTQVNSCDITVHYSDGTSATKTGYVESEASNIASCYAPATPASVTNFKAEVLGENVQLTWSNDGFVDNQLYLESIVPENEDNYSLMSILDGNTDRYICTPSAKGTRIVYAIRRKSSSGFSDSKYDFIYFPYRNAEAKSPICVKNISYTNNKIERWPAGKPEFHLSIFNVDEDGSTQPLQKNIDFKFTSKKKSQNFSNRKVYDWVYNHSLDQWYSMLTFNLIEYDRSGFEASIKLSAGLNKKVTSKKLELEFGLGGELKFKIEDGDEDCGNVYLSYYDNPEITLEFPNYGATITLSESK